MATNPAPAPQLAKTFADHYGSAESDFLVANPNLFSDYQRVSAATADNVQPSALKELLASQPLCAAIMVISFVTGELLPRITQAVTIAKQQIHERLISAFHGKVIGQAGGVLGGQLNNVILADDFLNKVANHTLSTHAHCQSNAADNPGNGWIDPPADTSVPRVFSE